MKKLIWLPVLLLLAIVGCKQFTKRPAPKPPLPPMPPGFTATRAVKYTTTSSIRPVVQYLPTDFAVTSVRLQQRTNVVLTWINGTPPFQPQFKTNITGAWVNYGPSTSLRTITNAAPAGGKAFFRVQSVSAPPPGSLVWVKSTSPDKGARPFGIRTDSAGNVVVVGEFFSSVDFGGQTLVAPGPYSCGYVVKYNSSGVIQWSKAIGGVSGNDGAAAVAIDNLGNIAVVGNFFSTNLNLGGTTLTNTFTNTRDIFVAKFTPTGAHVWSRNFGTSGSDQGTGCATDANGNVYVCAQTGGTINFGNGIIITGNGGFDITMAKYAAANGTTTWAKFYGGTGLDFANGIAVDQAADVLVTGVFAGNGNLGGTPIPGSTSSGVFVAKYSGTDGAYRWAFIPGGINASAGLAVATDPHSGNVVWTGNATGEANFTGGPIGENGVFLAAQSPSGTSLWALGFGGGTAQAKAISVNTGAIGITGQSTGLINFGGDWLLGNGNQNYVVAIFTFAGNSPPVHRWSKRAQGTGSSSVGNGISFDNLGNVTIAGTVLGTADIGGGTVSGPVSFGATFVPQYVK